MKTVGLVFKKPGKKTAEVKEEVKKPEKEESK